MLLVVEGPEGSIVVLCAPCFALVHTFCVVYPHGSAPCLPCQVDKYHAHTMPYIYRAIYFIILSIHWAIIVSMGRTSFNVRRLKTLTTVKTPHPPDL